ncbi:acyl-CoA dehydrogenase family protein [Acidimicrobiia bacterium EGI L10123]|uniref:acyl-CoA dehydrogenase family protein n=1 Tax=Salinilacustrithrix flava TaxID=2957203 RepID=UPI003D7C29E9|nr:acyl-CoA dehydrogenase family protein [Acidimicrobiia bacterium EGI L10123]
MAVTERTPTVTDPDEQRVLDAVEALLEAHPPKDTDVVEFLGAQFDSGLAWVHYDEGFGGLGLPAKFQKVINERLHAAGAPNAAGRNPIGHGMSAPTIYTHGSDEQKRRYLRPLFTGEEIWCQLFSEPGAGSDVAGLSSSAVKDGDEWIVNGQKVWTTLAHVSRFGTLVARHDPQAGKHAGLTHFVVDMQAPGVEVRPLRQMTGDAEFNEVYFTDVRIPDAERLGEVGEGWRVAITTLMNERVSIGGSIPPRESGPIAVAKQAWQEHCDPDDGATKDEFMQLWVRAEISRLTNIRASEMRKLGDPGPEGSVAKLAMAELNKDIMSFAVDCMGAHGMLYGTYDIDRSGGVGMFGGSTQQSFLRSRANSIEGGTTEVMKNILGERVLGLPGDIRVDKDKPWSEVPRS